MSITYQDIHLEDKALWQQLKTAWDSGNYSTALSTLKLAALSDKQLNSAVINAVTAELTRLQNQKDDTFKSNKIKVMLTPSGIQNNEVVFRLIGAVDDYNEQDAYYVQLAQRVNNAYNTLNVASHASQIPLTYDTCKALGITGVNYTLDQALRDVKDMFDYIKNN